MKKLSLLILVNTIILFLYKILINTDDLIIYEYGNVYSIENIEQMLRIKEKGEYVGFFISNLIIIIKIFIISYMLDIGCYFFNSKITFSKKI